MACSAGRDVLFPLGARPPCVMCLSVHLSGAHMHTLALSSLSATFSSLYFYLSVAQIYFFIIYLSSLNLYSLIQ